MVEYEALNRALNDLLDLLPQPVGEYARETALITLGMPLWVFVGGHLIRAYENGVMTAPLPDPGWSYDPRQVSIPLDQLQYKCEWCSQPFTPKRYKQRFCKNECGLESARVEREAERQRLTEAVEVVHGE